MEEKLRNNTNSLYEVTETITGVDSLLSYLRSISDTETLNASTKISHYTANAITDLENLKSELESLRRYKIVERREAAIGIYPSDALAKSSNVV
jgi:hypothetical protein